MVRKRFFRSGIHRGEIQGMLERKMAADVLAAILDRTAARFGKRALHF